MWVEHMLCPGAVLGLSFRSTAGVLRARRSACKQQITKKCHACFKRGINNIAWPGTWEGCKKEVILERDLKDKYGKGRLRQCEESVQRDGAGNRGWSFRKDLSGGDEMQEAKGRLIS